MAPAPSQAIGRPVNSRDPQDGRRRARRNQLLAALPAADYRRLLPRLQPVTLQLGSIVILSRGNPRCVYFPIGSILSLSYGAKQRVMAKACEVGNEGIVGISTFLSETDTGDQAEVEIAGQAFQLDAEILRAEFQRGAALQKVLLRYVEALITQASQLVVCGQHHSIDKRLCRLLLRIFDRMPTNELAITQQRIAGLLGVRRESVTEAAGRLQEAGIIHYDRGEICLLNRKQLQARTCACYAVIRDTFKNLHPGSGSPNKGVVEGQTDSGAFAIGRSTRPAVVT